MAAELARLSYIQFNALWRGIHDSSGQKGADADPTKAFFVRMITRDITLEDCIFDLVDNSIDGAWELAGGHPLSLDDSTDLILMGNHVTAERRSYIMSKVSQKDTKPELALRRALHQHAIA